MRFWTTLILSLFFVILSFIALDRPIAIWSSELSDCIVCVASVFSWIIDPSTQLVAWPVLFFLFFYLFDKKKASVLLVFILSVALTLLAGDILKFIFGRARPEELLLHGVYGFTWFGMKSNFFSFPSSHACAIGAVMGCVACLRPRFTFLWFVIALALSFSRIIMMKHYFSDILFGVMLGFLISQIIFEVLDEKRSLKST